MDYIKNMYERMNLQQIRSFLLYGTDDYTDTLRPYQDTIKRECEPIYKRLETIYPDANELDKAVADLSQALTAYEYVYMELGMQAGARLIHALLQTGE